MSNLPSDTPDNNVVSLTAWRDKRSKPVPAPAKSEDSLPVNDSSADVGDLAGYLTPAAYQWIVDMGCTPYLVVDTRYPGVDMHPSLRGKESVTLNVSPDAISNLVMTKKAWSFSARFNTVEYQIRLPIRCIRTIFPRERPTLMLALQPLPPE